MDRMNPVYVPNYVDRHPAEVSADVLRKALPGFATRIDNTTDSIFIRGGLPISATLSQEAIFYPAVSGMREQVQAALQKTIDEIRKFAIEAVGLQPVIDEMISATKKAAYDQGFGEGHAAGLADGRRALLQEWAAAVEANREGAGS